MTKKFWSGARNLRRDRRRRRVVDDGQPADECWARTSKAPRDTGLHVFAATAVANWNQVAIGSSVLGKLRASLAPDPGPGRATRRGQDRRRHLRRAAAPWQSDVFTRSGTTGALIGWSNPTHSTVSGRSANLKVQWWRF